MSTIVEEREWKGWRERGRGREAGQEEVGRGGVQKEKEREREREKEREKERERESEEGRK